MSAFDLANIDVEDFLECLEIEYEPSHGKEIRFPCPFHGGLNNSCSMDRETTAFFCHKCKERGTAVTFSSLLLGVSPIEAIRMLKQRYQPGYINPDAISMVEEVRKILDDQGEEIKPQPLLPEDALKRFAVDWHEAFQGYARREGHPATDYMFERGFDPYTLTEWDFGYDSNYDRVTLPIRDESGKLIGFKARAYDARHPKYLVLGDRLGAKRYGWPCYFPSRVVFGAHRIDPGQNVVVCEGELNVVALSRLKVPAIAINGSHFSDHHARVIRKIANRAILFLDSDKAGHEAVWGWTDNHGIRHPGIVDLLAPYMHVSIVPTHESDPAAMTQEQVAECLENAEPALLAALHRSQ